ncbi:MAG: hypothetical protein JXA28_07310 [Bacteroidetes bacterium]|nr:hypothetical protein [Bacteroidota bacterium]
MVLAGIVDALGMGVREYRIGDAVITSPGMQKVVDLRFIAGLLEQER